MERPPNIWRLPSEFVYFLRILSLLNCYWLTNAKSERQTPKKWRQTSNDKNFNCYSIQTINDKRQNFVCLWRLSLEIVIKPWQSCQIPVKSPLPRFLLEFGIKYCCENECIISNKCIYIGEFYMT
jgi:hypothetical protein